MSRSAWKGPFIDLNIVRRFDELLSFSIDYFLVQNKLENVELSKKFLQENSVEILSIAKQFSDEEPIEVWSRRSFISPEFLGFCFLVYNGHVFQRIVVQNNMIGHKFGEFAVTKRIGPNIHIAKKKKKK
jgi:small subunit ribosomal protein S19